MSNADRNGMAPEENAEDGLEVNHPRAGHVYSVASRAYAVIQQRESHPVVVMSPIQGTGEWNVWVRTSKLDRPGFDHPTNLTLGLERRGRFCPRDITRLPSDVFLDPKLSTHRGALEPEMFKKLMDWWML
jgi:hypothetical protein